jgi:DNA-directed RNA polymerase specialized sigma24 family protein
MSPDELGPLSPSPAQGGAPDDLPVVGSAPAASEKFAEPIPFIDFYDHEYHPVVRFVMNCGASLAAAEDAAQDAFLDAWKLMSVAGKWATIGDPRGWIRTVALNKYRRPPGVRRLPLTTSRAVTADAEEAQVNQVDLSVSALHVMNVLRSLEPGLRAVMAFDLDGFTAAESGRHLGLTDQQVRDRRKKARKILAGKLGVRESERGQGANERESR